MTRIEDVSPEEEARRWGQKEYVEAMQYVQSAEFFPSESVRSRPERPEPDVIFF
jgi:hypothetical protein